MPGLVAEPSWVRATLWSSVPGYGFSEHVVPLLLWVPSRPPVPCCSKGTRAARGLYWGWQSSGVSTSWVGPTPALWIQLLGPLEHSGPLVLAQGFSACCSVAGLGHEEPFGAPCGWVAPSLPRASTQDLVPVHGVMQHLMVDQAAPSQPARGKGTCFPGVMPAPHHRADLAQRRNPAHGTLPAAPEGTGGAVQGPGRREAPFPCHPSGLSPSPPRQCWLLGFSGCLPSKPTFFGGRAAAASGATT